MKKTLRTVLLIFFACTLVFSAWKLLSIYGSYQKGQNSYDDLEQYASFQEVTKPNFSKDASAEDVPESTEAPDLSAWPQVDFDQLSQINPDIVGWIYIEGTNINYPVVQGSNNDYYLRHLFDGTYNGAGCIFLDAGCASDFSDKHSIIYGHHMKDGSMFYDLMGYKDQAFYDEHAVALFMTPTAYYKIQFFSGYVAHTSEDAWNLHFDDDDFKAWLNELQSKSCFEADYAPSGDDRIVTLSTCTYEFASARFVLHGYVSESITLKSK
jgi:sortase B